MSEAVPRPEDQPHVSEESDAEGFQAMQVQLPEPEQAPADTGRGIGTSTLRKEDAEFITGQGRFVDDIVLPGMHYLGFVRSPHAHAEIGAIDTKRALELPGVTAVFTAETLGVEGGVPCAANPTGEGKQVERPVLARGKVRMVGEPVAVVVAENRYAAADGAAAVEVDYEPLPAVASLEAAVADGAPQVHDEAPGNLNCTIKHETEGFADAIGDAEVVIEQRIVNQRLTPVAIEPRGVVAQWVPANGEVTLYTSTQVPHFVKTFVAVVNGTSEAKVRVIAPDVGGGFGSKLNTYAEEYVAVGVSKALGGTPVKWTEGRSENMLATTHGRDHVHYGKLYARSDGTIIGLDLHVLANMGAYLQLLGPTIPHLTLFMAPGLYAIEHYRCRVDCVFTNTTPCDAYRGAGRPEATHLIERLVDILARRLDMDPVEVRRKNFAREFPFTSASGLSYDSGEYEKPLDKALELIGYDDLRLEQQQARSEGRKLGIGISTYVEICGLAPSAVTKAIGIGAPGWESSTLRLHPTGKATVITGTSPHGQGHATTWSQIVETELGIPVRRRRGDSRRHGVCALRPRHLRLTLARSWRNGALQVDREGQGQGPHDRSAHARSLTRRPRVERRRLPRQGLARPRAHDPGRDRRCLGGRGSSRGRRAGAGGDDLFRPAQLHVPVRMPHLRHRGGHRDGQGRDQAVPCRRRLRARDQSDDRRRASPRRRRAIDRPGPVRRDGL